MNQTQNELNNLYRRYMVRSRQRDQAAVCAFFSLAEPVFRQFACIPYFRSLLGKEETYSIAAETAMEFLLYHPVENTRQDLPRLLKHRIRCDLINLAHKKERRDRMTRQPSVPQDRIDDETEDADESGLLPADPRKEPENLLLQKETVRLVHASLPRLKEQEQDIIRRFYFRNQSVAGIAREMHLSENRVSVEKRRALHHLKTIFNELRLLEP